MKRLHLLVPALVITASAVITPASVGVTPPAMDFFGCDGIRAQQGQTFTYDSGYHGYFGDFAAGEQLLIRPAAPGAVYGVRTPAQESAQLISEIPGDLRFDVTVTGQHKFSIFSSGEYNGGPGLLTYTAACGIPPTVTITNPTSGGVVTSDQAVTRGEFSCAGGTNPVATCASSPAIPATRPGTHTFSVTATDTQGLATTRSVTYTVPRIDQVLTFATAVPAGVTWGSTPYAVSARSTSGLPVTISVDPASTGCAAPSGGTRPTVVSFPRPGTCIVHADQVGDDTYLPAGRITQTFDVGRLKSYLTAPKASKGLLGLSSTTFRAELDADQFRGTSPVIAGYPGQDVTFWVGGKPICSATSIATATDDPATPSAVATCKAPIGFANVSKPTYTVTFGGNDLYLPSSATGVLR